MRSLRVTAAMLLVVAAVTACSEDIPSTAPTPPDAATAPTTPAFALVGGGGSAATLKSRLFSNLCLSVPNGYTNGKMLEMWTCNQNGNQQFVWNSSGTIVPRDSRGLCINASGGQGRDGDAINLWTCYGPPSQKWTATPAGEIKGINGKCIGMVTPTNKDGTRLTLQTCNGYHSQRWDNSAGGSPPPKPVLQGVVLTPASVSIAPGGKQQFTASGKMSDGSITPVTVTAVATGGTVSSLLYTAGQTAGTYRVIATQSGGTFADTSAITITASAPPPPPVACTGVQVTPGASIQAAVNASPTGTTFCLRAGTHVRQSVIPKSGDRFIGEAGTVLDGQGAAYAFAKGNGPYPSNVTIQGLKITNYTPPMQSGTVDAGGYGTAQGTTGWVIDRNEVSYNGEYGIRLGNSGRVTNNNVHHNKRLNISGSALNTLVEGNEIAFGNYLNLYNTNFEAGGTKFTESNGLELKKNYVHDNVGVGLHIDMNNINTIIDSNRVDRNGSEGIAIELSYKTTIFGNTVTNNGWADPRNRYTYVWNAGIGVHGSPNVEVYGNTVSGNYAGIVAIEQNRTEAAWYGPHIVQNLYVHNNTITQTNVPAPQKLSTAAGVASDIVGNTPVFTSRNNRFVSNTYNTGQNPYPFHWQFGPRTKPQWIGYGQDASGNFTP